MMIFEPGLDIHPTSDPIGFSYGHGTFGPELELRRLDSIRKSLRDPYCSGPEIVYAIAMDVGKHEHVSILTEQNLLFGAVVYSKGRLGDEPIRSQGHKHAVSRRTGWSTPEVYEIWDGQAIVYMQERTTDDPGRCFAVSASPGDIVIVPPYWAHATISADPDQALVFGAWCVRDYAFDYDDVRSHNGLAWYPVLDGDAIVWEANPSYEKTELIEKRPRRYTCLGVEDSAPIYTQFEDDPDRFLFVSQPVRAESRWVGFEP